MTTPAEHPSFLELYRTRLTSGQPETTSHVEGCDICRAHLSRLLEPALLPNWAKSLGVEQRSPAVFSKDWILGGGLVATAITVCLALVLTRRPTETGKTPTTGLLLASKGEPSVAVYIKHGQQIDLWDGTSTVSPGDRLRLEIAGAGLRHLAVASRGHFETPLYAGALEVDVPTLLPAGWVVDEQPGPEALDLVLSRAPLDSKALATASAARRRDSEVWTTTLSLPKAGGTR